MQRLLLALCAAGLTTVGVLLWCFGGIAYAGASSICLRAGLVLGAMALAFNQLQRFFDRVPPWYLASVMVGFLLVIRWPKSAAVVVPVLVILWFLGPRNKKLMPVTPPRVKAKR